MAIVEVTTRKGTGKMRFLKLAVAFGLLFATSAHAEWLMVHIADARGESTGDKGASVSAELPTAGKCKFTIKGNRTSSIKCDYFNLTKGTFKGGRHWNIQMEVGGEVSTVKMRELGRRDGFIPFAGFFAVEPTQKIIAAAMNPAAVNDPEDALTLSIPYYKQGVVPLKFPLNGLREALKAAASPVRRNPTTGARVPTAARMMFLTPGTHAAYSVRTSTSGSVLPGPDAWSRRE